MIVLDAGPLVAAFNNRDQHHKVCAHLLNSHPGPLMLPAPVLVEVCQIVERRNESKAEATFLATCDMAFTMVDLTGEDLRRMSVLVDRYANLPLGAVDASVIAVAERLNASTVATLDRRHFTVVRPRHVDSFDLLPAVL